MDLKYYFVALDISNHEHGRNFGLRNSGFKYISQDEIILNLVEKGETFSHSPEINLMSLIHIWNKSQSKKANILWIYSNREIDDSDIFSFTSDFFKD